MTSVDATAAARASSAASASPPLNAAAQSLLRQHAYIAGAWVDGAHRIDVVDPATGVKLATVPDLGTHETERAVAAADRAFTGWSAHSAKERAQALRRWHDLVIANREALAWILTAEQGKPLAEARGEIAYAAGFVEWFAEEAKRGYGDIIPGHTRSARLWVEKRPVGVVAAITPWNFPAAMITRKVAPALASGCTVVLKPSELTPLTALALAALAEQAELPAGVFNVVTGRPRPIGDVLVSDPRIAKFTFTGSTPIGKMLAARCMTTLKRLSLELGGNAPFIVCADADVEVAAAGALASKFRNTGQTCVCANRFLVHERAYDAFSEALTARVRKLRLGAGLSGESDQGPLINAAALIKVEAHVADATRRGANIVTGGQRAALGSNFFEPTVLTELPSDALICREETFGPVAGLVRVASDEAAIQLANDTRAGLAAYLFTQDFNRAHSMSAALQYGMVGLNTGLISTEVAPFGGCKESGLGREGSHYGLSEFQDLKTICAELGVQKSH